MNKVLFNSYALAAIELEWERSNDYGLDPLKFKLVIPRRIKVPLKQRKEYMKMLLQRDKEDSIERLTMVSPPNDDSE